MSSDRWKRIDELFGDALELAPEARDTFLESRCAGDVDLLARIKRLLQDSDRAGPRFLERLPIIDGLRGLSPTDGVDPLLGRAVGRYTIQSVIACGGLGTVYLAEQENPRRGVALKVLRANFWNSTAEKRFDSEAHILGYLRHPNIAQIYEAGTHSLETGGTVRFFAMEYVPNARPMTLYANEKSFSRNERLEVFLQLCDAVHHGHQKGVIHRDLKPANVLVDNDGRVKVIDFGIARATDSDIAVTTMHTEAGQILGTLAYMSPEQCAADPSQIDTMTDVYSLGVILYELLTGRMPYDVSNMTIQSAARVICEKSPSRPSEFNHTLRGDAETIVLKTIEKTKAKRYQSAAELAADIRRFANNELISARPPTTWSRAVRLIARHPVITSVVASIVIAVASIAATIITVWVLNARPNDMRLSQDGRKAHLISVAGNVLKDWNTDRTNGIRFRELVWQPSELGGERLALLGFDQARGQDHPNSLCAYRARGDFEMLAWERHIEDDEILPQLREQRDRPLAGKDFGISLCKIADVFPESPGDEIIAVHTCPSSSRILRIYDLRGEILFQVWHRGTLNSCYWLSGPRLLVFSGDNAEAYWDRRGHPEARPRPFPLVVFALRPKYGFVAQTYLSSAAGSGPLSPAWYRCLLPAKESAAIDSFHLDPPPRASDAHRFVHFNLYVNVQEGTGVSWTLNEDGEEVTGSRVANDEYTRQRKSAEHVLPDPTGFYLGELPPLNRFAPDDPAEPIVEPE